MPIPVGFVPSNWQNSTLKCIGPEAFSFSQLSGKRTGGFELRLAKSLVEKLVYTEARNGIAIVEYLKLSASLKRRFGDFDNLMRVFVCNETALRIAFCTGDIFQFVRAVRSCPWCPW